MAKSKEDYVALGKADGLSGVETHKPKSGWQLVFYTSGWEAGCDERASYEERRARPLRSRQVKPAVVREGRAVKDARRRCEALIARFEKGRRHRANAIVVERMNRRQAFFG